VIAPAVSTIAHVGPPKLPSTLSTITTAGALIASARTRLRVSSSFAVCAILEVSLPVAMIVATSATSPLPAPGVLEPTLNIGTGPSIALRPMIDKMSASAANLSLGATNRKSQNGSASSASAVTAS
jgi:hypothetical protein